MVIYASEAKVEESRKNNSGIVQSESLLLKVQPSDETSPGLKMLLAYLLCLSHQRMWDEVYPRILARPAWMG